MNEITPSRIGESLNGSDAQTAEPLAPAVSAEQQLIASPLYEHVAHGTFTLCRASRSNLYALWNGLCVFQDLLKDRPDFVARVEAIKTRLTSVTKVIEELDEPLGALDATEHPIEKFMSWEPVWLKSDENKEVENKPDENKPVAVLPASFKDDALLKKSLFQQAMVLGTPCQLGALLMTASPSQRMAWVLRHVPASDWYWDSGRNTPDNRIYSKKLRPLCAWTTIVDRRIDQAVQALGGTHAERLLGVFAWFFKSVCIERVGVEKLAKWVAMVEKDDYQVSNFKDIAKHVKSFQRPNAECHRFNAEQRTTLFDGLTIRFRTDLL